MGGFLEPSGPLIAFLFVKRFVYIELLLVLALLRVVLARGPARLVALIVAVLAAAATLTVFAPMLGLTSSDWYLVGAQALNAGAGLRAPLALSALLFLSGALPARPRHWIDVAHVVLLLAFLGLWGLTLR